jgi:hypothetical protein
MNHPPPDMKGVKGVTCALVAPVASEFHWPEGGGGCAWLRMNISPLNAKPEGDGGGGEGSMWVCMYLYIVYC